MSRGGERGSKISKKCHAFFEWPLRQQRERQIIKEEKKEQHRRGREKGTKRERERERERERKF